MQLEQSFAVALPVDAVWSAFHDPALLVSCLPGASLRGPAEGERVPLLFKVKLGPIAAAFAGEGTLTLDEPARSGGFAGQATDGKSNSRVKGEARFALSAAEGGTRVAVAVSFTMTGSLAQFSREGIVRGLADQLTKQFAANLQARLVGQAAATDAPPSVATETVSSAPTVTKTAPPSPTATDTVSPLPATPTPPPASDAPAAPAQTAAPAPPRPLAPATEAPALNLLAVLGAVFKHWWLRLWGKA